MDSVDAKFSSDRGFKISGISLLISLGIGLSTASLILDWAANRSPWQAVSLTLPLLVCTIIAGAVGFWAVPKLQALKAGQVIRDDGPKAHLKKAGTPTMGGIFFVPVALIIGCIWSGFAPEVLAVSGLTFSYGLIGFLDDWQIIRRKSNAGISSRQKLALQLVFAIAFCLWLAWQHPTNLTTIALPLGYSLPLGLLFWPLAAFVMVAESNATNLTDGVDGLASGTVAIALLALGALVAPTSPGLMIFCVCMSGSCVGFLTHNRNPARVFMGDTGSLALGGALASVALLSNSLWALFILSGIFFVETLSVMAQVGYYKATKDANGIGKRLFKMAPLHHHLELSGWSELQVVTVFYSIAGILAIACLALNTH